MATEAQCAAAEVMAKSVFIRASCLLRTMLAITAVIVTLWILKIRGNYMVFHANARVLLYAYILWNFLLSVSFFVMNLIDLIRYSVHHIDWCDYLISVKIAYPIRAFNVITVCGIELTLLSFCVERAVAVFFYSKYEKSTSVVLACVLIVFQIVGAVVSVIAFNIAYTDFNSQVVQIVIRTSTNFRQIKMISWLHLSYGLTALIVIHALFLVSDMRCRRYAKADSTNTLRTMALGEKYQLKENRQSIISMLPLFWATFIISNTNAAAAIFRNAWLQIGKDPHTTFFMMYSNFFNNIVIVLPFAVCAALVIKFPKLREKLRIKWRKPQEHPKKKVTPQMYNEGNGYFNFLDSQWKGNSTQKKNKLMCITLC